MSGENSPLLNPGSSLGEEFDRNYVAIEREDYGLGVEKDSTTLALERCHRTVLQPMRLILCLLAWQPFGLVSSRFRMKKALNLFYFLLILALVCSHYAIGLVLCQFEAHCVEGLECRAVMRHALPDLVHLCAFINAFVFFRYRQSGLDQIEGLIQTVFVAGQQQRIGRGQGQVSQDDIIRMLRTYVVLALLWVLVLTGAEVMRDIFVNEILLHHTLPRDRVTRALQAWQWQLALLKSCGAFLCNLVHGVIVGTFCMYTRLVAVYIDVLRVRVQHRIPSLSSIISDVTLVSRYVDELNRGLGVAVSFVVYFLLVDGINVFFDATDWARSYYWNRIAQLTVITAYIVMLWVVLRQASRLTSQCRTLRSLATAMHQGYRDATQPELDSFMLLVCNLKLQAEVLAIPVTTAVASRVGFSFMLAMLTLGQLGWLAIHWTVIIPIDPDLDLDL